DVCSSDLDQYTAGARFADAMMIEPRKQVELRHVVEETPPADAPDNAFCGTLKTGYLAIAKVMEGDTEVVKVLALSGQGLPAASATDIALCAMAEYCAAPEECPAGPRVARIAGPESNDSGRRAARQPPAASARRLANAHRRAVCAVSRDHARTVARPLRTRPRAGPSWRTAAGSVPVPDRDGAALLP